MRFPRPTPSDRPLGATHHLVALIGGPLLAIHAASLVGALAPPLVVGAAVVGQLATLPALALLCRGRWERFVANARLTPAQVRAATFELPRHELALQIALRVVVAVVIAGVYVLLR